MRNLLIILTLSLLAVSASVLAEPKPTPVPDSTPKGLEVEPVDFDTTDGTVGEEQKKKTGKKPVPAKRDKPPKSSTKGLQVEPVDIKPTGGPCPK